MSISCENIASSEVFEYTWHSPGAAENRHEASANIGRFYTGRDIAGTAYGAANSFCDFPASAYRTGAFAGIWKFSITYSGTSFDAYCLEKGITGANGNPYASIPVGESSVPLTEFQQARIAYILANTYPVIDAGRQFENAGVSAAQPPSLDINDAYAVTQVAIWSVINEPTDHQKGWSFYNCSDGELHPKSERLRSAVARIFEESAAYARNQGNTPAHMEPRTCCKHVSVDGATLINCGGKRVRMECGKWLYGPLMARSSTPFMLMLTPVCEPECLEGFITLSDACGNPILNPAAGQEFYIAFPSSVDASCYEIEIAVIRTVVDVVVMENTDAPPHLQALIFTPRCSRTQRSAKMCFCIAPPETRRPERQFPFCFINNNHAVSNSGVRADERESDVNIQNQRQFQTQGRPPMEGEIPKHPGEREPHPHPKPECETPKIPCCPCPPVSCSSAPICPCPPRPGAFSFFQRTPFE